MRVLERIAEQFSSTWKLLSETNRFLAKTSFLAHYEAEFTEMRTALKRFEGDRGKIVEIRDRVIQIRKNLRLSGYDLSLAEYDIVVAEYRNDASLGTYTRLALLIGKRELWSLAGEANHEALHRYLDASPHGPVQQVHSLWFRWEGTILRLSGSDSESRESFEVLISWCEVPENRHLLLRHMKSMHG